MPDKDEIDVLLDSALASYADPGPDWGIERRVLAAVAAKNALVRARAGWWRHRLAWAIAVPVMASLVVWVAVSRMHEARPAQTQQAYQQDRVQARAINAPATTAHADSHQKEHPSGAKAHRDVVLVSARVKLCPVKTTNTRNCASTPKLDVFPSPHPLTAEEQVLVAAAHRGSKAERNALDELRAPSDAPLSIAALDVAPLASRDDGKN